MKIFSYIRELVWPLLEKEDVEPAKIFIPDDIKVHADSLDKTFEFAMKEYQAEEDRIKSIEAKSSLFIGTISVITTVLIATTTVLVKEKDFSQSMAMLALMLSILTIYMARTIWFSIKALERRAFHTLSIEDFVINDRGEEYKRKIIADIASKAKKNAITINTKVDGMVMAQEYFKRAIGVVFMYALALLFIIVLKMRIDFPVILSKVPPFLKQLQVGLVNSIILYSLVLISLATSLVALRKSRSKR
jgi:hypothetical protein